MSLSAEQELRFRKAWNDPDITLSQIGARFGFGEITAKRYAVALQLPPKRETATSSWTAVRVERMKELWDQGYSASQIANDMKGVTRNAIIGKIHRLGLRRGDPMVSVGLGRMVRKAKEPKPPKPLKAPKVARAPYAAQGLNMKGQKSGKPALVFSDGIEISPEPKAPFHDVKLDAFGPIPGSNPRPWTERPRSTCTWPVGEDADGVMLSCCLPVAEQPEGRARKSWCAHHMVRGLSKPAAGRQKPTANELMRSLRRYVA